MRIILFLLLFLSPAFAKEVRVIEGTAVEVDRVCRKASKYRGDRQILACALPSKTICIIIFPRGVTRGGWLFKHEMAHCEGWNHG